MAGQAENDIRRRRWVPWLMLSGWLLCAAVAVGLAQANSSEESDKAEAESSPVARYVETLKEGGVDPTAAGVRKYLHNLRPSADHSVKAAEYVKQLAASDWRKREEATKALLALPTVPAELLEAAAGSDDLEVSARAREVLRRRSGGVSHILLACFRILEHTTPAGSAEWIIEVLPVCQQDYLVEAASDALAAVATTADADILRKCIRADSARIRRSAIPALGRLAGKSGSSRLRPLLKDSDDRVRLTAAVTLLNLEDRTALGALVDLLSSKTQSTRMQAVTALRVATGKYHGFLAHGDAQQRAKGIETWRAWVDKQGGSTELRLPVKLAGGVRGNLHGNRLVAYGYRNRVEELDPSDKVVWSTEARGAWSAEKLANGNVLIAAYSENLVLEVDAAGKRVWSFGCNALNAEPLPNGNFLVADYGGKRALEVSRDKKIVWSYKTTGSCCDAERLPNGNTLVAAGNSVEEVTPKGEVVWNHDAGTMVYGIQWLPNGNVLMALLSSNKVEEVTPQGKSVWTHNVNNPSDAYRLPDGNTLVTGNARAVEVTPQGKEVWSRDGFSYGTVRK